MTNVVNLHDADWNLRKISDDIHDALSPIDGEASLPIVIGVLELVKREIIDDHMSDE